MISRGLRPLIMLLVIVLLAAACSSESADTSTTITPTDTTTNPVDTSTSNPTDTTTTVGSDPTAQCVADASAFIEPWTAEQELQEPTQQIDVSTLAGQSYWLLLTVTNQFSGAIADGYRAAAEAAGVEAVVFDGKGTVTEWARGLDQAISQGAAGIVLWGIPPELVDAGVQKAKAAGIPVIDSVNGSVDDELQDGISAHVDVNAYEWGAVLANWMLAESECNANVGVVWPPAFGGLDKIANATKDELASKCPECKFVAAEMDVANLATTLGGQARTMLTANPDLNFFTPLFDSAVTFVAPVIEQEFPDVQIGSHDGVDTSLQMVRDGGPQTMDMAYAPLDYLGWQLLSIQMGMATGLEPDPGLLRIPERLVTTENIPPTDEEIFPAYANFEDAFKSAWGL